MLDDYLSQCSGGVDIPVPNDDAVAPMTKCFMELDTDMAAALKTPKYGFADICQATYKMHKCMDAAFITDNNPAMDMVMLHMNDTRNTIIDFLRSDCSGFSKYHKLLENWINLLYYLLLALVFNSVCFCL